MIDDASMAAISLGAHAGPVMSGSSRSFIKVALVGAPDGVLRLHETGSSVGSPDSLAFESMRYEEAKREFRRRYYTGLYAVCRGNLTQMAKRSGLQRLTVREALREVQLDGRVEADVSRHP